MQLRRIIRILLSVALFGKAVNLLIFTTSRLTKEGIPVIFDELDVPPRGGRGVGNPLSQVLILTKIVISFSILYISDGINL